MNTGGALPLSTAAKLAYAYQANDFAAVVNGGTVSTDTLGAVPTALTRIHIGCSQGGNDALNGTVKRFRFYNTRLTNAQLQSLTS